MLEGSTSDELEKNKKVQPTILENDLKSAQNINSRQQIQQKTLTGRQDESPDRCGKI